ncbi:MAG: hypothetical protein GKR89_15365 [Candidatus Latescibacteria bacterium]|nr:hypothetical protein [Candidatus Latescibacterota bacterium]
MPKPHLVRLNVHTNPVLPVETDYYRRYDLAPLCVEANTPDAILAHAAQCDILFVVATALPRSVIDGLQRCRLIARLGNGTDKIDVARATQRGLLVANAPYFCVAEMSDHILAMLLSLARQLPHMDRHMRSGAYYEARDEALQLPRLEGLTLGLVGFGATGPPVAKRAQAFGMRVVATRRRLGATPEAEALGVEMLGLEALLEQADFVSLQLPLTKETHHLLDEKALRRMKPGAILINTSRGALVDEDALARVLAAGHLGGAGLDTFAVVDIFAENPQRLDHPLTHLDNVLLSPHVSGMSAGAAADVARTGVQNAVAVLAGHRPPEENIVNPKVKPWCSLAPFDPACLRPTNP